MEAVKVVNNKGKSYAKKQTDKVKASAKRYGSDIRTAYDIGYAKGWDDAYTVPKRVGAKTAAAYGYKKGLTNRRKSDKYTKQYGRRGNA